MRKIMFFVCLHVCTLKNQFSLLLQNISLYNHSHKKKKNHDNFDVSSNHVVYISRLSHTVIQPQDVFDHVRYIVPSSPWSRLHDALP